MSRPLTDPGDCRHCDRPMRRKREHLADRPGTISVGRKGECVSCCNTLNYYGLTRDEWVSLLMAQSGRCAVCSDPMRNPHVDHCHRTGRVRGLLCPGCNAAEGLLKGDPARALALAAYMQANDVF